MKRRFKWILIVGILGLGVWYFFIKEHQYQVSFTVSEPPGILFKHILDWQNFDESEQEISVLSRDPFSEIKQRVTSGDSTFLYHWCFKRTSDSVTKVIAYISDEKNGFTQKIQAPFRSNDFVKRSVKNVKLVGDALLKKEERYRVHSIKDTILSSVFCAYIPLETKINEKAASMIRNIGVVMDYIKLNDIPLIGDPFLEVTEWNTVESTIKFNFCFPISKPDSLPSHPEVKFKTTSEIKGLKAEFNGNYRISENAWYYLIDYAEVNNISVTRLPIEIFLNDPHSGGNPLEWKALIFLPIEDKKNVAK